MKRIVVAALLAAAPMTAQQKPSEPVTKVVHLKYVDPQSIRPLVQMFGPTAMPDSQMKVIIIKGSPAEVAAAEQAIAQLDVAPKDLELVVHFVVGSDTANPAGAAVPAEIRDVISQLKSTFTFKEYRMMDVLTLRTRAGSSAETTGILDVTQNPPRLSTFSIQKASVGEDGTTIRIDRMHAGIRIPLGQRTTETKSGTRTSVEYMNTGIDQDVDVKEGQKVVVGRASLQGPDKALFLILTAKVVQ
jgi:hypothetical protein